MKPFKSSLILSLLFVNLLTIFFAINEGWNLSTIMWIYWFQSIIIGIFYFIKILRLKNYPTANLYINNELVSQTKVKENYVIALFFLVHYGGFHLGYFIFLFHFGKDVGSYNIADPGQINYVYLTIVLFFINHLFSYILNDPKDDKEEDAHSLMRRPYVRVIPMHLTILLATVFPQLALILFLFLKTAVDIIMDTSEQKLRRNNNFIV